MIVVALSPEIYNLRAYFIKRETILSNRVEKSQNLLDNVLLVGIYINYIAVKNIQIHFPSTILWK